MLKQQKLFQIALVIGVFFLIIALWEIAINFFHVDPLRLPPPENVGYALIDLLQSGKFWDDFTFTMHEVLLGYACAIVLAAILGVIMSEFMIIRLGLMPYIIAFQTIPTIALAPLFTLWFGYGMTSKVVMAASISFFPMVMNVIVGLQSAGREKVQMVKSFGATPLQVLLKVKVPNSLPFLFAGLSLGIIFALIGAIVAEYVGGSGKGLGLMLMQYRYEFDVQEMFAVIVVLAFIGIILHAIIDFIKQKVVFWNGDD